MGNFKRGDGKRFNGSREGGFGRRDRVMHQVVCDQCGKPCEVPFRPTGDKPVYCSSCFEGKRKTRGAGDRFSKNKFSGQKTDFGSKGNNDELKKQLVILNGKMDQLIKAVEAMANTKTIEKKAIKKTRTVKDKKSAKKVVKKKKN
jgi:CxxC-x17-CxxC domain-containing protein